jgi:N-methylhydantoinase A
VVLGHIPAEQRLGGTLSLERGAATAAMAATGMELGLDATELAIQALDVINFRMAEAIRALTVERGLDPASFALCAFGGAGGLHATALADELGVTRVVIPALPGSFSAWGMLQGGIRHDVVQSFFRSAEAAAHDLVPALQELEDRALALLEAEGVAPEHVLLQASADLRYLGQEYSLTIELPPSRRVDDLVALFHERYRQRYGHASPGEDIELVALRVAATARFDDVPVPDEELRGSGEPIGTRTAYFGDSAHTAQLWWRGDVAEVVEGPALVLEETATTLVPPGWQLRRAMRGHLVLERGGTR